MSFMTGSFCATSLEDEVSHVPIPPSRWYLDVGGCLDLEVCSIHRLLYTNPPVLFPASHTSPFKDNMKPRAAFDELTNFPRNKSSGGGGVRLQANLFARISTLLFSVPYLLSTTKCLFVSEGGGLLWFLSLLTLFCAPCGSRPMEAGV